MDEKTKKKVILILKASITLALIFFIFSKVDLYESFQLISNVNILILIPLFLYIPGLIISTLKWKIALDKEANFYELFIIYWISNFFSNFLPSTIGGDSYKVLSLRKKYGTSKLFESIFLDRFSGMFGLVLLASFTSFFIYKEIKKIYIFLLPNIIIIGFLIIILIINLFDLKKNKYVAYFEKSIIYFNRSISVLTLFSLIYIIFGGISLWAYYLMFGYYLNFVNLLGFYCVIQLISMLPLSINSLGLREGSIIYFFMFLNVPAEVSLSVSILSRIIIVFQTALGGLIYILKDKYSF